MKARKTLQDLRPNATVLCLKCGQTKPQTGSRKFRAHHVCADCIKELQELPKKEHQHARP